MKHTMLEEAQAIVDGGREQDYPDPVKNFRDISVMASLMTGKYLSPQDCVRVLIAVKLTRDAFTERYDNKLDIVGYTYILNKIIDA